MPTRAVSQRDVAARAGVSTATVSYILSGRRDRGRPVTTGTRDRVLRAAQALGYQRNHAARSLRRARTDLVGVVYRPPSNPWMERLVEQVHGVAVDRGYAVMTVPIGPDDRSAGALRVLRERYVDGAVLMPDHGLPGSELASLARNGLALLAYDDALEPDGFDVVWQGKLQACKAAVVHLLDQGHRRIAYLGHADPDGSLHEDAKFPAYRRALAERGVPPDPSLCLPVADSRTQAYRAVAGLVDRPDRPTAIFSASDRGAIASMYAAADLGLSVPDDLAVAGVGHTREGAVVRPALTSVGLAEFDFAADVDRLFRRIDGTADPGGERIRRPWELAVRASTQRPR